MGMGGAASSLLVKQRPLIERAYMADVRGQPILRDCGDE
jgi:hypothetical protein